MSKWALFCAHRYLEREVKGRTIAADGRLLQRPWRLRSPAVQREAARRRAARHQPRWPRALGWVLLGGAACAVVHPDYAMPSSLPLASARRNVDLRPIQLLQPLGPGEGVPAEFRWEPKDVPPPYRVVFCDENYAVIATVAGITSCWFQPDQRLGGLLAAAGNCHWYVAADAPADGAIRRLAQSAFGNFEIR